MNILNEIKKNWPLKIIEWEKESGRDFPWRKNRTPYKVLISELLLKRTTSTAVSRIFEDFIQRYPNIITLSKASKKGLEKILSGIGLQEQKSLDIQQMTTSIMEQFNGSLPDDFHSLISVPGIGDYTASSLLVFGFNKPKAIVDSNVIRILSRAFYVKGKGLNDIAEKLVPRKDADLYNYGLLDLGAIICHYSIKKCPYCPVKIYCKTWVDGIKSV